MIDILFLVDLLFLRISIISLDLGEGVWRLAHLRVSASAFMIRIKAIPTKTAIVKFFTVYFLNSFCF